MLAAVGLATVNRRSSKPWPAVELFVSTTTLSRTKPEVPTVNVCSMLRALTPRADVPPPGVAWTMTSGSATFYCGWLN